MQNRTNAVQKRFSTTAVDVATDQMPLTHTHTHHPGLTHKQATVGGPIDGDAAGCGVVLLDQILCRTLEVVKAVLLVPQCASCKHTAATHTHREKL